MTTLAAPPPAPTAPALLSPDELTAALAVRDLSDPADGPHAMQRLVDAAVDALATTWGSSVRVLRTRPVVPLEDNYDRLGYDAAATTRDSRYTRYVSETTVLRSHTSAGVPHALRRLAREPGPRPRDLLLALPGLCYRRDAIDRLHVGTPHQLDLWRVVRGERLGEGDLEQMIGGVVEALLPGARWRSVPATHPYTTHGRQVDVETAGGWVELAECGLASPSVLAGAGLDPGLWSGLALGLGLDRALMLRKGVPDIRWLRSPDPRAAAQMADLAPWRPVSSRPAVRRDLSLVTGRATDAESVGDQVREALGDQADAVESVVVLAVTAYEDLPPAARDRLQISPHQANALVRLVLRPVDRTLTDAEANVLRDRVYAALHEGPVAEWAAGTPG